MYRKFSFLLAMLLITSMLLGACGGATPTAEEPASPDVAEPEEPAEAPEEPAMVTKDEVVIAGALPLESLDPHNGGPTPLEKMLILNIHDSLLGTKDRRVLGEVIPQLATEWSVSDDGLVWTFKLREGVVWQKGYGPFTAEDVVFSYERLLDPERSIRFGLVASVIKEVRALDDYTVEMELFAPSPDFLIQVLLNNPNTSPIVSKAALEDIGNEEYMQNPIGTGPYQVAERTVGEITVIEVNPDYWGDAPDVARFVCLEIPEESLRADALELGEIDIASFRDPTLKKRMLASDSLITYYDDQHPVDLVLMVDENDVPDVRVREAIYRSINKQELAATVLELVSNPNVVSYMPPGLVGHPGPDAPELYPYDPDLAKDLLSEAGIEPGELTLTLIARADFGEWGEALEGYIEAIGIDIDLQIVERAVHSASYKSGGADYDLQILNPGRPTATQMLAFFASEGRPTQYEATGYPERVLELFELQSTELDEEKRLEYLDELLTILETDIPFIVFGYWISPMIAYQPYISAPFDNWGQAFSVPFQYITVDQEAYAEYEAGQ
jgi:peptide/nickel transport system substrate-binding protein